MIEIYTAGASITQTQQGGYAIVIVNDGQVEELTGAGFRKTTSNRMNIAAAVAALDYLEEGSDVRVKSTSEYLVNTMTKGWARNANSDLWEMLEKAIKRHNAVAWELIKQISVSPFMAKAVTLAFQCAKAQATESDDVHEDATLYDEDGSTTSSRVMTIDIHTDGSCLGNPGKGGWAALFRAGGKERSISGGYRLSTNNRMELMAVIEALQALKTPCNVNLYTDSEYIVNTMTKGWAKNKNKDLWNVLDILCGIYKVRWVWVKGHANNEYNNMCDALARRAATENATEIDSVYEQAVNNI